MDSSAAPSDQNGQPQTASTPPPLRRRLSMEEDMFYQQIMTAPARRPSQPPPYEKEDPKSPRRNSSGSRRNSGGGRGKGKDRNDNRQTVDRIGGGDDDDDDDDDNEETDFDPDEKLPDYTRSVFLEGVFQKKHEVENTTKRAEDRHWHTMFVQLNGTVLNIYNIKKDWGWGRSRDGPSMCADNPPWVRKSKLEKSYSLQHADAGIAADYQKRRYVIRIRAETDQFLLSCIELETFVKWLECLFAAIDVSAPLEEREFPRDMSIPRIQRLRWFRGETPAPVQIEVPEPEQPPNDDGVGSSSASASRSATRRGSSSSRTAFRRFAADLVAQAQSQREGNSKANTEEAIIDEEEEEAEAGSLADEAERQSQPAPAPGPAAPPRIDPIHRLSTTSYPNEDLDQYSGKWWPEHAWSDAHDLLYAKLCYSNLLFRSPRKSNFVINEGKEWFVDWATGKTVRVLPPNYGDDDYYFGPWQVIHTDNRRI